MRKNLPLLILQGTDDLRVSLQEGYHMIEKLKANGNPVTYIEVPGGNHCLKNQLNTIDLIADWFESESLQ
jgi:dipeptidyl aminopeptidase/acylaminoacyl peptidase